MLPVDVLSDLYKKKRLLTSEELRDRFRTPNSSVIPDFPPNFREWYFNYFLDVCPMANAEFRTEFEARKPALGLTTAMLDELSTHVSNPLLIKHKRVECSIRCEIWC